MALSILSSTFSLDATSMTDPTVASSSEAPTQSQRHGPRGRRGRNAKAPEGSETAEKPPQGSTRPAPEATNSKPKRNNNRQRKPGAGKSGDKPPRSAPATAKPSRSAPVDIRDIQIQQVLAKYADLESLGDVTPQTTKYPLVLQPSDPQFPFPIEHLHFDLNVPLDYPRSKSWITVKNDDIPKGYSANIEVGFSEISSKPKISLLSSLDSLDLELEQLLKREKQATIKIVKHKPVAAPTASSTAKTPIKISPAPRTSLNPLKATFVPQSVTDERYRQLDMLCHRLGDKVKYNPQQSRDVVTVEITPPHSEILPDNLAHGFVVKLHIPENYGIIPCSITLLEHDDASLNIMANFNAHARSVMRSATLLSLMNYLSHELDNLMLPSWVPAPNKEVEKPSTTEPTAKPIKDVDVEKITKQSENLDLADSAAEAKADDNSDSDSDSDSDSESEPKALDGQQDDADVAGEDSGTGHIKKRGTGLELEGIEMSNIAFLECHTMNIAVECNRCKTDNEITNIVSGPYGRESKPSVVRCRKCDAVLAAALRKNFVHSHNHNAGYFDFSGCVAADILPGSYTATCGQCTTSWPQAFRKVQFGRVQEFNCRECHTKMTLLLPGYSFDIVTSDELSKEQVGSRAAKKTREKLGLIGGTSLPNGGACQHYRKSQRWFRFSCCGKVYACDRCHDEDSDHSVERAHRMICGKCSREQNFSETCTYCRNSFETRFSAFWEGGKGTRDKVKMSRRDPRKYKRTSK